MKNINIEFETAIKNEETLEALKVLFSVYEGEVVLDREMGIDSDIVSQNINIVRENYTQDAMDKVKKYFPDLEIVAVDFKTDEQGQIRALIDIRRVENGNES